MRMGFPASWKSPQCSAKATELCLTAFERRQISKPAGEKLINVNQVIFSKVLCQLSFLPMKSSTYTLRRN